MTRRSLLALFTLVAAACTPTPPPPEAPPPPPPPEPAAALAAPPEPGLRLLSRGDDLYLTQWPQGSQRTALLYVLDPVPLTKGGRARAIGVVVGTEPRDAKVAWYCPPADHAFDRPADPGLLVEVPLAETKIRIGKCLGEMAPRDPNVPAPDGSVVSVTLELGQADGVAPGDLYEIYAESRERFVTLAPSLSPVAVCSIKPHAISPFQSQCLVDRELWPAFSDTIWNRGGVLRLKP